VDTPFVPADELPLQGMIEEQLAPGQPLPLVMRPDNESPDTDLLKLVSRHRKPIRERLLRYGGILFRGFPDVTVPTFRSLIVAICGDPLQYLERSSPRHEVKDSIYTSTDYPAKQSIFLHNEQSYNVIWPLRIFFHCVVAAPSGGATPLADCRRIYQRISAPTREKLAAGGYCYARHFGGQIGLTWQEAFQASERAVVEEYCGKNDISFEWALDGTLCTRQIRPVISQHPDTLEPVWFNHLTFFNIATLGPQTAKALLSLGKEQLPNNTYYADGTDIEPAVLAELRAAYLAELVTFSWQPGDILMLDNMLVAHGREPFTPPREVVVGMAEPYARP
jgi:alpha-ketoglutarate-dependent taurine dioxygenase